jgi:hypothetical protein
MALPLVTGVVVAVISTGVIAIVACIVYVANAIDSAYGTTTTTTVTKIRADGVSYYENTEEVTGPDTNKRGHYHLTCVICHEANTGLLFRDCNHLCVCVNCGAELTRCPMCRTLVSQPRLLMTRVESDK